MRNATEEELKSFTYALELYGFPDQKIVKLTRPTFPLQLSLKSEKLIDALFGMESAPLNYALETIAKAVNDSVEYDFPKAIDIISDAVLDRMYFKCDDGEIPDDEFLEKLLGPIRYFTESVEKSRYQPNGKETYLGICTDAGRFIRELISQSIDEDSLRYQKLHVKNGYSGHAAMIGGHDGTLVFDVKTGNWVVINSKSPRLAYNLVPKERLSDLYLV